MPASLGRGRRSLPWPDPTDQPLHPKKRLGQHFLVNRGVLAHILEAAALTPGDCVVEVGPGAGILTRALLERAGALVAVELDRILAERLHRELGAVPGFRLLQGDILDLPPPHLLELLRLLAPGSCQGYKVVANLPYYITAPTLRHFLTATPPPERMVVMVQWEVARSIVAKPGDLSLLAIAVQFYGRPELVAAVAPGSFSPPPRVRSAILRIDTYPYPPVSVPSADAFFDAVRAGFSARRKQLHNALASAWRLSPAEASALLGAAGIDPQRRAQSLSLEEWAALAWARRRSLEAA